MILLASERHAVLSRNVSRRAHEDRRDDHMLVAGAEQQLAERPDKRIKAIRRRSSTNRTPARRADTSATNRFRSRSNSLVLARNIPRRAGEERHHDRRLGCTEHQFTEGPHKRIKAIRRRIARERFPGA
jgi:hypothetical protein